MNKSTDQSIPRQVLNAALNALSHWDDGREAMIPTGLPETVKPIVHNLVLTQFRHRARIDWTISKLSTKPVEPKALHNILRVGLCQIFFMDGIAPATAVDECVENARRRFGKKRAGFINAVLRNAIRKLSAGLQEEVAAMPLPAQLELSDELCHQWKSLSSEALAERAQHLATEAPLTVRLRGTRPGTKTQRPVYLKSLPPFDWAPNCQFFECSDAHRLFSGEDVPPGQFYAQDPSTALAPHLLAPRPNEVIADLCAAPGGKTLLLNDLSGGGAEVIAMDHSTRRIRRLMENSELQPRIRVVAGDAKSPPFADGQFDAILLDVPCSNTGVIRRRPDVRWRFSRESLKRLVQIQQNILETTAKLVRNGGRLVYSTCSIETEENSEQIQRFLENHKEFQLDSERLIAPNDWNDGGYAARLTKSSS